MASLLVKELFCSIFPSFFTVILHRSQIQSIVLAFYIWTSYCTYIGSFLLAFYIYFCLSFYIHYFLMNPFYLLLYLFILKIFLLCKLSLKPLSMVIFYTWVPSSLVFKLLKYFLKHLNCTVFCPLLLKISFCYITYFLNFSNFDLCFYCFYQFINFF